MITIEIKQDEITGALARLSAFLSDMTPATKQIGEYLVRSTQDRFPTGTAPDGSAWAAKSPATLAAYGARGDTRPLFGPSGSLSSLIYYEAGPVGVAWGSPMVYAAMMQFGGSKAAFPNLWGDIPARPFLGLSPEDEISIIDILAEWAERAAAGGA